MTWNIKDLDTPISPTTGIPFPDRLHPATPTTAMPAAMPSHELLEQDMLLMGDAPLVPLTLRRDYEAMGLVPEEDWARWRRLVTRGIHAVE